MTLHAGKPVEPEASFGMASAGCRPDLHDKARDAGKLRRGESSVDAVPAGGRRLRVALNNDINLFQTRVGIFYTRN